MSERYTAKRLLWDMTPEEAEAQDIDLPEYPSNDLEGKLEVRHVAGNDFVKAHTQYLVDGQLADPLTLTAVDARGRRP